MEQLKLTRDQLKASQQFLERPLNFSEVGSGKTATALQAFKNSGCNKLLVVCLATKVQDWHDDGMKQNLIITPALGSPQKRAKAFQYNLVSISFESSWRTAELTSWLDKDTFVVFDEAHKLKNPSSRVSKYWLSHFRKVKHVYLLTGSPITNGKYEEYYVPLKLTKLYKGSKTSFENEYTIKETSYIGSRGFKVIVGYKNLDTLNGLVKSHSVAIKRHSELIPNHIILKVPEPKAFKQLATKRMYKDDNGEVIALDNSSLLYNALRRVMSGSVKGVAKPVSKAKLERVRDILESSPDEKVVIFYNYNTEYELLKPFIESLRRPLAVYNGSVKDLSNWEQDRAVALVHYKSGSTGLNNFSDSHIMIHYSVPNSSTALIQSQGRITRHTSTQDPIYYYLLCDNELDREIYNTIKSGKDINDTLIESLLTKTL